MTCGSTAKAVYTTVHVDSAVRQQKWFSKANMYVMKTCLGLGQLDQWSFGIQTRACSVVWKTSVGTLAHILLNVGPNKTLCHELYRGGQEVV